MMLNPQFKSVLCLLLAVLCPLLAVPAAKAADDTGGCSVCSLAGDVDGAILEKTVRELSGADSIIIGGIKTSIGTRYAYSDMKFNALEYCRQKVVEYGYSPRVQSFQFPPRVDDIYALERSGDTLWAGARDGTVYRVVLENGPGVFRRAALLAGRGVLDLARAPNGALFAACDTRFGSEGALYRSIDGGSSWEQIYQAGHSLYTISFADSQNGIAAGLYGTVIRTADGGRTWAELDPALFDFRSFYCSDWTSGVCRLAGRLGTVYTGEGLDTISWRDTSICNCTLSDISFSGQASGIAVGDSSIFRTGDGGESWSRSDFDSYLISVAAADTSHMAAGGDGGELFITSDGGVNWNSVDGVTAESRNVLLFAGADSIYSAGDNFVTLSEIEGGELAGSYRWTVADTVEGKNLIFTRTGIAGPDRRVVVCAHYDSQNSRIGESPYETAPGADDNGSGTAAVLECARLLSSSITDYTVEFVLFDGEEVGLHGSRYFAAGLDSGLVYQAVFNLDMIGADYSGEGKLLVAGREEAADSALYRLIETSAGIIDIPLDVEYLSPSPASDHRAFWEEAPGIPSVLIIEGGYRDNPYYHSSGDTADNIDIDYLSDVVKIALSAAAESAGYRGGMPEAVSLAGNYPNPFSRKTAIRFELTERVHLNLAVFDVTGRKVIQLMDGPAGPGKLQYTWDGRNSRGGDAASGVYLLRFKAGAFSSTRKIVIVK